MNKMGLDRLAAGGGIVAVVLFIVSSFITGTPPKVTDSAAKMTSFFVNHHRSGLIGSVLFGLGLVAMVGFVGMLASAVRRSGQDRYAAITLAAAVIAGGLATAGTVLTTGLYYDIALKDPTLVRPLYTLSFMFTVMIGFPTAVWMTAAAIGSMRTQLFPRWYGVFSLVAALVSLVSGGALAHSGFYSPSGGYTLIAFFVFAAWTVVTSSLLLTREETAPATALSPA
jgi:hypothetical protein